MLGTHRSWLVIMAAGFCILVLSGVMVESQATGRGRGAGPFASPCSQPAPPVRGMAPADMPARFGGGPPSTMLPGSALSGRVMGRDKQPLAGIEVRLLTAVTRDGVATAAMTSIVSLTDSDGRYRFVRPPNDNEYLLGVLSHTMAAGSMTRYQFPAEANAAEGQRQSYVTTLFPGVASLDMATRVRFNTTDQTLPDMEVQQESTADVRGVIARVRGRMLITLRHVDPRAGFAGANEQRMMGTDGAFQFTNVAFGTTSSSRATRPAGRGYPSPSTLHSRSLLRSRCRSS